MIQLNNEESPLTRCKDAENASRCRGGGGAGPQICNQAVRPGRRGSGKLEVDETLFKAAFAGRRMTRGARRCCGGSTASLMTVWRLILRRVNRKP
jgi:hypothetical protein